MATDERVLAIGDEAVASLRSIATCGNGEIQALGAAVVSVLLSLQREDAALDVPVLESLEVDVIKKLYSALVCLFVEAAKHDASVKLVVAFLCVHCGVPVAQAEIVASVFGDGKERLRAELALTGEFSSIARLRGVDWRLQYRVAEGEPPQRDLLYHVVLKTTTTTTTGERGAGAEGDAKTAFVCSVEQLQDLVATLKDACKAVERSVHRG